MNEYEYFADGTVSFTGYVCILEEIPLDTPNIPQNLITTDKDKALQWEREYGYKVYSIKLLKDLKKND